jgi:hypothetical protein
MHGRQSVCKASLAEFGALDRQRKQRLENRIPEPAEDQGVAEAC